MSAEAEDTSEPQVEAPSDSVMEDGQRAESPSSEEKAADGEQPPIPTIEVRPTMHSALHHNASDERYEDLSCFTGPEEIMGNMQHRPICTPSRRPTP